MKHLVFTGVIFLFLCFFTGCGTSYMQDTQQETTVVEDTEIEENATGTEIFVQVDGAVQAPGVYQLPYDARVYQAIEIAGGLREDADASDLNQAEKLEDGQKIYVHTAEEMQALEEASAVSTDGLVNINMATVEDLMTLPGIGESKANDIISYRESNGAFTQIEDLKNIPGIKDGIFNKISDSITVD